MEDLPLGRISALVPEFTVKDLTLGRTLMMIVMMVLKCVYYMIQNQTGEHTASFSVYMNNKIKHNRLYLGISLQTLRRSPEESGKCRLSFSSP